MSNNYSSDVENNDVSRSSDKSATTTDDEFFGELMDVPPEFEDHLLPDHCLDEPTGIEHIMKCLDYRFRSYPVVFMGTLKQALTDAFTPTDIKERRPLLIYVNNDKSVYSNLFCKQLLCNDKTIDYLMNNYFLWAWDVTFESNEKKLNSICESVFSPWTIQQRFNASDVDKYPLVIGICRDTSGHYVLNRLFEGCTEKLNLEQFLFVLAEFRDKFYVSEQQYQTAQEEAKKEMILYLFQQRFINNRTKHHQKREFLRSMSMHPHMGMDHSADERRAHFSRLLSGDVNMRYYANEMIPDRPLTKQDMMRVFEAFERDPDDADDEDEERTPMPSHPTVNDA